MNHKITNSVVGDDGSSMSGSRYEVGTSVVRVDKTIGGSQTDSSVPAAWSSTNLQSVALMSDKDCTVEFNSGSSPAMTIALKGGSPYIWNRSDGYTAYPFPSSVTGLFITTTSAVRFQLNALLS